MNDTMVGALASPFRCLSDDARHEPRGQDACGLAHGANIQFKKAILPVVNRSVATSGNGTFRTSRCLLADAVPQEFCKRFSGMIKQKLHLLFCKQRRRKHETHDNSSSLCVRALQYVRACKNGSS